MEFWIDIENASGVAYGSGPITDATSWQWHPQLDGAGTIMFTVPVGSANASAIQRKRIAHCFGILDGAVTDLGMGIIEKIETQLGPPTMLHVSGPDILSELAGPTVGDLLVREQQWTHLDDPTFGTVHWIEYRSSTGAYYHGGYGGKVNDNNTGTYATVTIQASRVGYPEDAVYVYIGCDSRYSAIRFTFEAVNPQSDADDELRIQYPCEAGGWKVLTGWVDNTNDGNGPWRQNGTVTFAPPDDWVRYDEAVGGAGNWYWLRLRCADNGPDNPRVITADIQEIEVYADFPTKTAPELVMAFAPVTWAISWAGDPDPVETVYDKYLQFQGESVLTALVMLSEQGGQDSGAAIREHFRLGTGRTVEWLGTTQESSGLRAVDASEGSDETVLIQRLSEIEDASEIVTRVYAWSGDGIGLESADDSPPTGYTLGSTVFEETARYYLEHDAGIAAFGAIEQWVAFSELSQQQTNTLSTHNVYTGNAVLARAAEYLRTHAVEVKHYRMQVVRFPALLKPGQTLECVYYEYRDGEQVIAIDTYASGQPLWVIGPTLQVTAEGVAIIGIDAGTVDRDAKTDASVVVDLVRERKSTTTNITNVVADDYIVNINETNLGGWTVAGDHLYAGSGSSRVGMHPGSWPFYAGAEDAASAPFRVSIAGVLAATGVVIEGELTATTGELVDLDVSGVLTLVSGGYVESDNFVTGVSGWQITYDGTAEFQDAVIVGEITATTGELVDLDVSGTLTLVANGIIESDNYVTGLAGWQIDYLGNAEFGNIYARGRIDTVVFQYDQISAISGSLLVTPEAGALAAEYTTGGTLTIEGVGFAFADGSVVRIRAKDTLGAVREVWVTVTRTLDENVYTTVKQSGDDATWPVGTAVLGYGTGGGSLMMTAADALDGPRYSVNAHGTSPWTDEAEIGRFGLLDGWEGYVGAIYGIGIGDYSGGNYLLFNQTDGFELKAGDGGVSIDADGISLDQDPTKTLESKWLKWLDSGTLMSYIYAEKSIDPTLWIQTNGVGVGFPHANVHLGASEWGGVGEANILLTTYLSGPPGVLGEHESNIYLNADFIKMTPDQNATTHLYVKGNIELLDDSWIGYPSGPLISFDNTDEQVEITGDLALPAHGMIRDSYPMRLRLTRRTSDQSVASGTWAYRYMNTVEYASAGSGIGGSDLQWMHTPLVFSGTGLNDLTHLGKATYPDNGLTYFQIKITATGTPDSFQYSMDNGATWNGSNIAITGAEQSIGGTKDVRIQFGATTGHTLNDRWAWDELPRYMIVAKRAGMYQVTSTVAFPATAGVTLPYRLLSAVRKNGSSFEAESGRSIAGTEQYEYQVCSALVWMDVGDYIDCPVFQESGVAKSIPATSDNTLYRNSITIARVA